MLNKYFVIGRKSEFVFAAFLFLLGAICTVNGWGYGVGQLNDIGPGAFPLGLGLALMGLAALAMREAGAEAPLARKLAPAFLLTPGIVVWALLIERAGLLVATVALTLFCALAEEKLNLIRALILACGLTLIGYVVFILGFNLHFDVFGDWL